MRMKSILTFEWEPQVTYKREGEDALFVDEKGGVFAVTDGVTRDKNDSGEYPYPSPARQAAQIAAETIGNYLVNLEQISERKIHDAFVHANEAVKSLNEQLGLWNNHDYLERDLAGTVGVCAVVQKREVIYGYIGDCGIAHLSSQGELLWHSDDDVITASSHFPKTNDIGRTERTVRVRRDFRNKPSAQHPTYGVLTGEEEAMHYVKTGRVQLEPGAVLVVYSDGAMPFIFEDDDFSRLLFNGNETQIYEYVAHRSSAEKYSDEKTLILFRTNQGLP